jgi:peptide/nickel transport system permease protein
MSARAAEVVDPDVRRPQLGRAGMRRQFLRELLWTRRSSGIAALALAILFGVAAAAPFVAPYDPTAQDLDSRYQPPERGHLLGTDAFGRDILSRIIWGARISLLVGIVVVILATTAGGLLGVTAGYVGGRIDRGLMFIVDMLMAFPLLLLALAFIATLGPGLFNVMMAIALGSLPIFARVMRAETRAIRDRDFVAAARSIGASHPHIIWRYILPNIMASIIVLATTRIGTAILTEASLSFLGLGIRPPTPSWGIMAAEGRAYLEQAPWMALIPGVTVMITLLSFNLVGDGLRDALDVRLRHSGR